MLDGLFHLALVLGCLNALMGDKTAIALVTLAVIGEAVHLVDIGFNTLLFMGLDLCAIVCISAQQRLLCHRDLAITLLFLPLWAFYLDNTNAGYVGASLTCTLQLFLIAPWLWLWKTCKSLLHASP